MFWVEWQKEEETKTENKNLEKHKIPDVCTNVYRDIIHKTAVRIVNQNSSQNKCKHSKLTDKKINY